MDKELLEIKIETRKLSEDVAAAKITSADATKRLNELRAKKAEIEKKIALRNAPRNEKSTSFADVKKAMVEKRAITLSGTGAINQVNELVKELQTKTPLLGGVKYFYGPNASTNIPVFSPTIAKPGAYSEGATSVAADTTASLSSKNLTPRAFVSLLPVSAETINLGSVNFEAELPAIFADAFAYGFHKAIATGTGAGNDFSGIFTVAAANTNPILTSVGGGDIVIADLVNLATRLQDYTDAGVIIINPALYTQIMADPTTGVAELYKEELIRNKTIEGVRVILTSSAPSSVATGAIVAVGGRLENYGVAMASEIQIDPIKKVGDTNTYFQATVFANGSPIINKEFIGVKMTA
jgi:HK97 family phage major capsid protein